MVSVISHYKILIFPKKYLCLRSARIKNDLSAVILDEFRIIDVDIAIIVYPYSLPRKSDDSFYEVLIIPILVRENNNIVSVWFYKPV